MSTAIAIADIIKVRTKNKEYLEKKKVSELLSALEDEIKLEINNKSILLSKILAIEIWFFASNREETFPNKGNQYNLESRKNDESILGNQGPSWSSSNTCFGLTLR